jgi:hypothetical protein
MRVSSASQRKLDPEAICTRVVARLIKEFACVYITPESPSWQDILHDGQRVGELRVYRGRGRVQKIVSYCFASGTPVVDAHSVFVFTQPTCPVPHLVLNSAHSGPRVSLRLDLLPKADLGVNQAYLDFCYGPLDALRGELDLDPRFTPIALSRRLVSQLSPWNIAHSLDADDFGAFSRYTDHYLSHWASLIASDAPELSSSPEASARDAVQRRLLFSRQIDQTWDKLDRLLGREQVDVLLAALSA